MTTTTYNLGDLIDIGAVADQMIAEFASSNRVHDPRAFRAEVLRQIGGKTASTVFTRVYRDRDDTMVELVAHDRLLATMMRTATIMTKGGAA